MKKIILFLAIVAISVGILAFNGIIFMPEEEFSAEVKSSIVIIEGNQDFDLLSNIKVTGGKVTCHPNTLVIGENIIKCDAKGQSKEAKKLEYTLIKSSTYKKNIIYFGDSITAGFLGKPKGYSWVDYIQENYDFALSVNAGISDYRVSPYDNKKKWLVTQVENHYNDDVNYDYVIMQGGINDVFYDTPLGKISTSFDSKDFDVNTFIGGLETYLYAVTSKWPDARIGYILTYYTPNYVERNIKWSYEDYKVYVDATIEVLDKWNVPYINLFNGSVGNETYQDILKVNSKTYLPDYLHLNNSGYEIIAPYLYNWMQTIDVYLK